MIELRNQNLTRYILPLREGGSLPALAEADDGFRYAVKFRGAGHGAKALIAELIGGLVAKKLGFKVPELVFLNVDSRFGITEPDEEIQDLLRASEGLNLGLHFLDRAMTMDPSVNHVDELTASKIVWLDAFLTNVDRTRLNTNILIWNGELWLIDHGASLFFQHSWRNLDQAPLDPFAFIKNHALLPYASSLKEADKLMRQAITPRTLNQIVDLIPDEWLIDENTPGETPESKREVYRHFLTERLKNSSIFVNQAINEREHLTL